MKNFNQLCKGIDWSDMAKARVTVKSLVEKKPQLRYLSNFLDALAESAVEEHGFKLNTVYPSAIKAMIIQKAKENKN
jgi:hypothetical protein